jgi:hypothetical protein
VLASFIQDQLDGFEISEAELGEIDWLSQLLERASGPRRERHEPDGAEEAARFILEIASE